MNNICMWYDLETTGLLHQNPEIVQFSVLLVNQKTEEVLKEINIFHKTDIGDYLFSVHGQEYQDKVNEEGLETEEFYNKIKEVIIKANPNAFGGHNIREFDNLLLKRKLDCKYLLMLLKQHDTRIYEQNILGCDKYGKLPNGQKVKTTLEACCERHEVPFDPNEAHDGLYDVHKSFELYLKQKAIFEKSVKNNLEGETWIA